MALVVLLGLLGVALVVTGVIDVPLDGLRAESVRPVPDEPTVVKRPGDVRGPVGASAAAATAAPGTDAPSPGAPAEPLAVEPILPAVDNPPLVVPAVGGASPGSAAPASESSDDIELAGDSEPEAPEPLLDELPVRRKVRGLIDRGEGLIRKGKYRSASRVLERAAKLDPNFPRVQRSLGIARARLGDFDGARKAYERYLELDPTAPDAADVRRILGQ